MYTQTCVYIYICKYNNSQHYSCVCIYVFVHIYADRDLLSLEKSKEEKVILSQFSKFLGMLALKISIQILNAYLGLNIKWWKNSLPQPYVDIYI